MRKTDHMQPRAHVADFLRRRQLLTVTCRSSAAFILTVFLVFAGAYITTRYLDLSTAMGLSDQRVANDRNQQASWNAPTEDVTKFNCDASWVEGSSYSGVAAVARNHEGRVLDGRCELVSASSPVEAELLAIQLSLDRVCSLFASVRTVIETDCRVAYTLLCSPDPLVDWDLELLVDKLHICLLSLPFCFLLCTSRSNNRVADCLGKMCRLGSLRGDWVLNPHPEVVNLLLADAPD